jgi:hypothetical protein
MKTKGYCHVRNKRIANTFNVSHENISKAKSSLKAKGFIKIDGNNISLPDSKSGYIPIPKLFIDFIVLNQFNAAELKALIFIAKTDYEKKTKTYGNRFYLSKTKFQRDTFSSPAVALKIIRLLIKNNMLTELNEKFENNISWYANLRFQNRVILERSWKLNFNNGKTWKKGECPNNYTEEGLNQPTNTGSKNCREMGQRESSNGGQKCSEIKDKTNKKIDTAIADGKINEEALAKKKEECNIILQQLMKQVRENANIVY